jgi:hypothetical protein
MLTYQLQCDPDDVQADEPITQQVAQLMQTICELLDGSAGGDPIVRRLEWHDGVLTIDYEQQ